MKKQSTLDFYAREAEAYATRYTMSEKLASFLALLPPGARILELGCGGGQDSEAMIAAGFDVLPDRWIARTGPAGRKTARPPGEGAAVRGHRICRRV